MIMDRQWKLVVNSAGEPYLLFDQVNDPDETVNKVNDSEMADIVARMRNALFRHVVQNQLDYRAQQTK